MKKILSIFILIGFVILNACDPMEDIYDEIDAAEDPISAEVTITLTADDYAIASGYAIDDAVTDEDTVNAENIEEMEAFNKYYTAEEYIPYVLEETYEVLDKGSMALITYNNYLGIDYLDKVGSPDDTYVLVTADYDAMGTEYGDPGYYNNFSSSILPEEYMPDFLLTLYTDAEEGDLNVINYQYYDGSTNPKDAYVYFDGTAWMVLNTYELVDADYDSMGDPGAYNNFSSSDAPEDYLPTFLKLIFPYDQAGAERVIVYKYYSSGTTYTRAQEYHYDGTTWTQYDAIVEVSNQFIHNGDGWVFDPTELVTMVSADFQLIVDYVNANLTNTDDYPDNTDNYFGASAYYSNFDLRNFNAEVFDSWAEAIEEALGTVLLPELYPNALELVNGVQMGYRVVFKTYDGTDGNYNMKFEVSKAGPDPEFTLVEGPTME
ncbi:MAG: hypothetical protein KOO66_04225 [Bacteroidales bacterium]|nr:hypothetical protein [Bacteroidales bacterium]